ncbi:MAG: hypothetical protein CK424_04655 [Legionella sp.]|nr:MAG: hypothetical protein CK424_04655 [Legionella sp.]
MRSIILLPMIALLSSCIYTEGQIINEPEDVVVSSKVYKYTPWYPCGSPDITQPERSVNCPKRK